uniref:Uncharacterized protein n=1 Tax=Arundo donax TaxID=35708 RepID=A0A0A9CGA8_ARUDO
MEQPLRAKAAMEEPQRIPSPPPLPQEQQSSPSPPPPLPQEPQPLRSRFPFPREQQPVVAVVPNVDEPEVVAEPIMLAKQEEEADQDEDTCFQEADRYNDTEPEGSKLLDKDTPMLPCFLPSPSKAIGTDGSSTTCGAGGSVSNSIAPSTTTNTFDSLFASATRSTTSQSRSLPDLIGVDPTFLCLAIVNPCTFAPPPAPHMSATALLQKAAEVGASQSSSSFLKEFGLASSSSSSPPSKQLPQGRFTDNSTRHWHHWSNQQMEMERRQSNQQMEMERRRSNQQMEMERHWSNQQVEMKSRPMLSSSLGLGLAYENGNAGLPDLMMGPSSPLFGPKPATLDFLGLGIGGTMGSSAANGGLPALMVGRELDMGSSAQVPAPWEDAKRKTNGRTIR